MDTSRKLYKDDVVILTDIQNQLLRRDVKTSQKELIDKAVRFMLIHREEFFDFVLGKRENTARNTRRFIEKANKNRVDFGKRWLEEIDTTL